MSRRNIFSRRRSSDFVISLSSIIGFVGIASLQAVLQSHSVSAFPFMPIPSRVSGFRYPFSLWGSMAEKVLENPKFPVEWPYSPDDFSRMDESDDSVFYDSPRLVYHIDDAAVSALTKFYSENLKNGEDVLDICSSWVSHYPKEDTWKGGKVAGVGMNDYELSQNPQLTEYKVRDLNENPTLPYDDASFDKVTCVVSIDYLNKPLEIMKEIGRVLRPGGEVYISMSNRCFPTKAFKIWLNTNDLEHVFIVGSFMYYAGLFEPASCNDISPNPGRSDPMFVVRAKRKES